MVCSLRSKMKNEYGTWEKVTFGDLRPGDVFTSWDSVPLPGDTWTQEVHDWFHSHRGEGSASSYNVPGRTYPVAAYEQVWRLLK